MKLNAKLIYLIHYYSWQALTDNNLKWLLSSNKFLDPNENYILNEHTHFSSTENSDEVNYSHIVEHYLDVKIKEKFNVKDEQLITEVINLGFNVNQIFEESFFYGENAIYTHLKSQAHSPEYILFLIKNNFDINQTDSSGKTLIINAVLNKSHPILIKMLMMLGANPYISDNANMDVFDYVKLYQIEEIYENALSFTESYHFNFIHTNQKNEFSLVLQENTELIHLNFDSQELFQDREVFCQYINLVKEKEEGKQEVLLKENLLNSKLLERRLESHKIFLELREFAKNNKIPQFINLFKENINEMLSYHDPIIDNTLIKEKVFDQIAQHKDAYELINQIDEYGSIPALKVLSSKNLELIDDFFKLYEKQLINLTHKTPNGSTIAKKMIYCLQNDALKYYETMPELLLVKDNDGTNLLNHAMKKSKYGIAKKLLEINPHAFNELDDYGFNTSAYIDLIACQYFWSTTWPNQDMEFNSEMYLNFNLVKTKLKNDFENHYLSLITSSQKNKDNKKIKI